MSKPVMIEEFKSVCVSQQADFFPPCVWFLHSGFVCFAGKFHPSAQSSILYFIITLP